MSVLPTVKKAMPGETSESGGSGTPQKVGNLGGISGQLTFGNTLQLRWWQYALGVVGLVIIVVAVFRKRKRRRK